MLRRMSSTQFKKWAIYESLEPFEEERADWRTAQVVTTLVNLNRKRGTRARSPKEFLIKFDKEFEEKKPKTWQDMKAMTKELATLYNSSPKKDRKNR